MQSLTTIAKGAGFVFVGMIISKFLSYLYRIIVARIGTAEYGVLSLVLAVFGIAGIVALLGLQTGVVRFTSFYKAKDDLARAKGTFIASMKITLLASVLIAIALIVSASWISRTFFHAPEAATYLMLLALVLPLYCVRDVIMAAVRAYTQKSQYDVMIRNVLENFIKVILCAVLVVLGYSVLGAVYATLIGIIITFLFSLYYWKKFLSYGEIATIEENKELLSYSLPLLLTSLLMQVLLWCDVLLIGYYMTTAEVGIYNAALPTATLMSIIPGGIIALFLPVMTDLLAKNKMREFHQTLRTATKWIFFLEMPVFLAMAAFPSQLLTLVFGNEYAGASSVLVILVFCYLLYQTMQPSAETLNALKKTSWIFCNTLVVAVLNVVLNIVLIPSYGMIGGAIATGVAFVVYGFLGLIEVYYSTGTIPLQWRFGKAIIAGVLAIAVSLWFYSLLPTVLGYLLALAMFGILYVALVFVLRSLDDEDKKVLDALLKKVHLRQNAIQ